MEDILSSIRRIISEGGEHEEVGKATAKPAGSDEVLELTKMVDEDGNLVELSAEEEEKGETPEPPASTLSAIENEAEDSEPETAEFVDKPESEPAPEPAEDARSDIDSLLSKSAAAKAADALSELARQREPEPERPAKDGLRIVGSGKTIEQYVLEMLRPMLKEWLDAHLPPLVERLVQKEIQKLSRRADLP